MNPGTRNDHIRRVRRVSEFIRNNLDGELTLDKLSREAHFSPFHFHRIFNAVVGESVMAHIRRLRLERAARHLKKTRRPVIRVALDTDYETPEAFCRAFKTLTGLSPSSFRKAIQQTPGNDLGGPGKFSFHDEIKQDLPSMERNDMDIKIENWEPRKVAFVATLAPIKSAVPPGIGFVPGLPRRDCLREVLKCSESVTMIRKRLLRSRSVMTPVCALKMTSNPGKTLGCKKSR